MMSMPLPLPRRCAHGYSVRALTIVRKLNVWRALFVIRLFKCGGAESHSLRRPWSAAPSTEFLGHESLENLSDARAHAVEGRARPVTVVSIVARGPVVRAPEQQPARRGV